MKKRLPVPSFQYLLGCVFDAQTVRQAAMMMYVVYERDFQFFANWQQISGRIQPIIVLQGKAAANALW
jgi:hypothetical protein